MDSNKRHILIVTGDTGFIGMNFIQALGSAGRPFDKVVGISKYPDRVTLFNNEDHVKIVDELREKGIDYGSFYWDLGVDFANLQDTLPGGFPKWSRDELKSYDRITIVNFASESHVDNSIGAPLKTFTENTNIVLNLMELIRTETADIEVRFYQISTDEVYGELTVPPMGPPFNLEKTLMDPRSPYSASKAAQEHVITAYHNTYGGFRYTIFRLSNQFGKYQYEEKLIPHSVKLVLEEKPIGIYGKGENWRQWSYVGISVEKILFHILQRDPLNNIVHIADGHLLAYMKNIELVKNYLIQILRGYGYNATYEFVKDRPGHDKAYRLDAESFYQDDLEEERALRIHFSTTIDWYIQRFTRKK